MLHLLYLTKKHKYSQNSTSAPKNSYYQCVQSVAYIQLILVQSQVVRECLDRKYRRTITQREVRWWAVQGESQLPRLSHWPGLCNFLAGNCLLWIGANQQPIRNRGPRILIGIPVNIKTILRKGHKQVVGITRPLQNNDRQSLWTFIISIMSHTLAWAESKCWPMKDII